MSIRFWRAAWDYLPLALFIIILTLAVLVLWSLLAKVLAHDWYPIECCSGLDCAPVESYSYVAGAAYDAQGHPIANPLPQLVVTTRMGTAVVPNELPRRESKDNRMHACIRPAGGYAPAHVICIFEPPGM